MESMKFWKAELLAAEEADRKLEKAVRDGTIRRTHNNDWISDAQGKGVITADEVKSLKELEALVARVIAVDHFDAAEVTPHFRKTGAKKLAAE